VGVRWMFHERMLHNSPLVTIPDGTPHSGLGGEDTVFGIAEDAGCLDDPRARDLIGEARMLSVANEQLKHRISTGVATGAMAEQAAAVAGLCSGVVATRVTTLAFELAGANGAAWTDDDGALGDAGSDFLMRQVATIGGGPTEMARNVVSERVLGMP